MRPYTVIIDDLCGNAIIYQVDAEEARKAADYALYIYNAHNNTAGEIQYVIDGAPVIAGIGQAKNAKTVLLTGAAR